MNVIFFLAGAAVLGAGLWVRFDPNLEKFSGLGTEFEEIKDALNLAAYILIAFGAFTFVVGFCGCCGAMRESKVRQFPKHRSPSLTLPSLWLTRAKG